mmetsp:Transcript_37569/g.43171  ORF Transcript_37569/g.43171 Transcript_37569/m.43171 type:complete len:83 (+) Transcript_37569:2-250(+)
MKKSFLPVKQAEFSKGKMKERELIIDTSKLSEMNSSKQLEHLYDSIESRTQLTAKHLNDEDINIDLKIIEGVKNNQHVIDII